MELYPETTSSVQALLYPEPTSTPTLGTYGIKASAVD